MNREQLLNVRVEIGSGENDFSMSRGSFTYKFNESGRQKLEKVGVEEKDGKSLISFKTNTGDDVVFSLVEENGKLTFALDSEPLAGINRYWVSVDTNPKEHIYGCGETYSEFDLKGQNVRIWVAEHQNAARISKKMLRERITGKRPNRVLKFDKYESYYAQPTFVSSDKYYVHCDINEYSEFDFSNPNEIKFFFEEPPVIITEAAESFEELSKKETDLLGRGCELPEWIYDGGIIAIQEGPERIDEILNKALEAGAKINGIWSQDWSGCRRTGFGYQVMWNWRYDEELYHDLPEKIKEWNAKGVKFLGYINPFLAIEKDIYAEASEKGYCVKDAEGKDYLVTITTFPAAMIDFTNPDAYEWYKNIIKNNMIGIGLSGWMADFGEYLPVDSVLFDGDPTKLHNQWPAIWAKLNREAIKEAGKEGEVFFFTRAGHTGSVADTHMMWTGDQHVDWSVDDGIASVTPATLSLAMSGCGVSHSDVGGYTTIQINAGKVPVMKMVREKELLLRWEEMNVFSPLWRTHEGNQPVNNVQFADDEELLAQLARCTKMHANLKPYLMKQVDIQRKMGTPVQRPIFYHYDEEWAYTEKTEYLLGDSLLVAPVIVDDTTSRKVKLPNDTWVHLFTGKEYTGGDFEIEAPIGQPPVFVKKDSEDFEMLMSIKNNL